MEAQISAEGKSPVLPSLGAAETLSSERSRKRESQSQSRAQSSERDGAVSMSYYTQAELADILVSHDQCYENEL